MYYLWFYQNDDTLKRSHHRARYDVWGGSQRGDGWRSRQAAHAYKTRNGLHDHIVMKAPEAKQIDLEDYIKNKSSG